MTKDVFLTMLMGVLANSDCRNLAFSKRYRAVYSWSSSIIRLPNWLKIAETWRFMNVIGHSRSVLAWLQPHRIPLERLFGVSLVLYSQKHFTSLILPKDLQFVPDSSVALPFLQVYRQLFVDVVSIRGLKDLKKNKT